MRAERTLASRSVRTTAGAAALTAVALLIGACGSDATGPESTPVAAAPASQASEPGDTDFTARVPQDPVQRARIVELLTGDYIRALNSDDAAAYASLFTDDAVWIPPNALPFVGPDAIEAGIRGALLDAMYADLGRTVDDVGIMGNEAWAVGLTTGTVTPKAGGDPIPVCFSVAFVLKRIKGEWFIHRQIWNDSMLCS